MREPDLEKLKINTFKNEEQFQAAAHRLIDNEFPRLRGRHYHIKNENWIRRIAIFENNYWRVETDAEFELRKKIEGGREKAKGVRSGMMDEIIPFNGIMFRLELKMDGGRLSESQEKLHELFEQDCPQLPTFVARNLYEVYCYCKWIVEQDLRIHFPNNFKPFKLT